MTSRDRGAETIRRYEEANGMEDEPTEDVVSDLITDVLLHYLAFQRTEGGLNLEQMLDRVQYHLSIEEEE